jgi:hypothetical protein
MICAARPKLKIACCSFWGMVINPVVRIFRIPA